VTPQTHPRRNIELKASDPDRDRSLQVCANLGAADHGEIWQRDSYFETAHGGLKLREERPGPPHLIQFDRADEREQRESRYRIETVQDPANVTAMLALAFGLRVTVVKRRRLFLWQQVRIHLDEVERLGSFIELEAVAPAASDLSTEHALVDDLRAAFSISDDCLHALGYADQLLRLGVR
jgi:predicted adenylyl cyclase CyaB